VQEARSGGAATGKKGEWLSLRYDLTAPLARYVAENFDRLPKPYRSYRAGWVFRNEKPGPGRFRQFMQFDADTVGAASPAADAEICMMAADTMEELGISRGQYVIKVNSRKVLDGLMEAIGLGGAENNAGQRLTVLRAIDKLDRVGIAGVRELLGSGRKDESGDFTPGASLLPQDINALLQLFGESPSETLHLSAQGGVPTSKYLLSNSQDDLFQERVSNQNTVEFMRTFSRKNAVYVEGLRELSLLSDIVARCGYQEDRIRIDPTVVRGLEYYTGPVYEADLTFEIAGKDGRPVRFGSVGGGGRYDGLVGRFMKQDVPATGFSVGVSRLQAALAALGKGGAREADGPVVVLVMDRARFGDYQAMVSRLRDAKLTYPDGRPIGVELYLGDSGMRAQMKYADRRNAPLAIIQGEDEKARGVVQIKDLVEGKRLADAIADHAAYREERPGQFEVAEAELVEAVKRTLARSASQR
jgi:histidyl-tRNA synthetase